MHLKQLAVKLHFQGWLSFARQLVVASLRRFAYSDYAVGTSVCPFLSGERMCAYLGICSTECFRFFWTLIQISQW
jgi:hypothetical protein